MSGVVVKAGISMVCINRSIIRFSKIAIRPVSNYEPTIVVMSWFSSNLNRCQFPRQRASHYDLYEARLELGVYTSNSYDLGLLPSM